MFNIEKRLNYFYIIYTYTFTICTTLIYGIYFFTFYFFIRQESFNPTCYFQRKKLDLYRTLLNFLRLFFVLLEKKTFVLMFC